MIHSLTLNWICLVYWVDNEHEFCIFFLMATPQSLSPKWLYLSHYLPKYSKSKESRMNFVSFSLCIMATPQPLSPKWLDYTYHTTYLSTLKVKKAGMEWKKFQHIMPIANHTLIHLCHNIFTMVRSKDIMQYYYYVDLLERLQLHFCMHF